MMKIFAVGLWLALLLFAGGGCEKKPVKIAPGTVVLSCRPEINAEIYANGKLLGVTPRKLSAAPGNYSVKILKKGYEPLFQPFRLKSGVNPEIIMQPVAEKGILLIESVPPGASVLEKNRKLGVTPLVLQNLDCRDYEFKLSKNGFADCMIQAKIVDGRPVKVSGALVNNIGVIEIHSKPSGARVFLDGKMIGSTPIVREIEDGLYKLRFSLSSYAEQEMTLIAERGKKVRKNCELKLLPGGLEISTAPAGAKVSIDGKYAGISPVIIPDLLAGNKYTVAVELNNYEKMEKTFQAAPGKNIRHNFNLLTNVGSVELSVNPAGVKVYLNNKFIGETVEDKSTGGTKILTVNNLKPGKYVVKAAHKRAVPGAVSRTLTVAPGQVSRLTDKQKISLWIPNSEITLNNGEVRVGVIYREEKDMISFSDQEGITYGIRRHNIKSVRRFNLNE